METFFCEARWEMGSVDFQNCFGISTVSLLYLKKHRLTIKDLLDHTVRVSYSRIGLAGEHRTLDLGKF